jgi:hypothetical protein
MGMVMWMVQFPEAKLGQYIESPEIFRKELNLLLSHETNKSLYLDKSWAGIHYILTGLEMGGGELPLSLTVYSEQIFDDKEESDMWPASFLYPEQVKEIDEILNEMDIDFFRSRYNPEEMTSMGIYPGTWSDYPDEFFEYLKGYFFKIKEYFKEASLKGHALASTIA